MDYIKQYRDWEIQKKMSDLTTANYITDIIQFLGFLEKEASKIDQEDIEQFAEWLKVQKKQDGEPLAKITINRKMASINRCILFLNETQNLKITARAVPLKIQQQNYLDDVLSGSDFHRMMHAAEKQNDCRAKAIFATLYYTGARVSEMLQLELADVERQTIIVKGKGAKFRDIFIPEKLRAVWREYLADRMDNSKMLFTGKRGDINRTTVAIITKYYGGQAHVKLAKAHPHSFRHLFCLTLVERGIQLETLADLAGHTNINTTRLYTRKSKKQLLAAINEM